MNKRLLLLLLHNLFLPVYSSYTYESTEEAVLLRDNSSCFGDCFYHDGSFKCVYDWGAHEAECKPTGVKTKKYRTLTGLSCYSNCGKYGETYDWCVTGVNGNVGWDRCTKLEDLQAKATVQTNDVYLTCADECAKRTYKQPWCNTVKGWKTCDPNKKVILFARHTESHIMCASPCSIFENKPWCYDYDGEWKRCYVNQNKDEELSKLSKHLKSHWHHGEYTKDGYKLCKAFTKRHLDSPNPANVESLADQYENLYSSVTVRVVDPNNIVTNDTDPTIRYTVFDTFQTFQEDQLVIPLVYRGIITRNTLRKSTEGDSSWTAQINNNFNRLNPILITSIRDDKGYLLVPRLGGPVERFNIFPQSKSYNVGDYSRWHYLVDAIYNFIDRHPGSYAEYIAVLSYDLTSSTPHRPTDVGVNVRLYNANNELCDLNGVILKNQFNILENMFFTNDPKFICTIE